MVSVMSALEQPIAPSPIARRRHVPRLLALVAAVVIPAAAPAVARAQALDIVHGFSGGGLTPIGLPEAGLMQASDGHFYGTTTDGGVELRDSPLSGAVFRMTPDGTVSITYALRDAGGGTSKAPVIQGSDGALYGTATLTGQPGTLFFRTTSTGAFEPFGCRVGDGGPTEPLVQGDDGAFYQTAVQTNIPEIVRVTPSGCSFFQLPFPWTSGNALSGLVLGADGYFYGTSARGGAFDRGVAYKWHPSGAFSVLHDFAGGTDGDAPSALRLGQDGHFYGTTEFGGTANLGTVFRMAPAGTVTVLHSFEGGDADGRWPATPVIQASDGRLYGTARGGAHQQGVAFAVTTSGTFSLLHAFQGGPTDGADPRGALVQAADGLLYGTTRTGGAGSLGTVFAMSTAGTVTLKHSFGAGMDGATPIAPLHRATDGAFYGTTLYGGAFNTGTVFRLGANGTTTVMHHFGTETDGALPLSGLVQMADGRLYGKASFQPTLYRLSLTGEFTPLVRLPGYADAGSALLRASDGSLYGTTTYGGFFEAGTVFRWTPDDAFSIVHEFDGGLGGAWPITGLVEASDGHFYGTTVGGGSAGAGTVFRLTRGGVHVVLHSFNGGAGGRSPEGTLIQARDGALYGTTSAGGAFGSGTIFRITLSGALTVLHSFREDRSGAGPLAGLIQASDGLLYGTTPRGGVSGGGTVFRITTGGAFSVVAAFNYTEGAVSTAPLVEHQGLLYGTVQASYRSDGAVFRLNPYARPWPPAHVTATGAGAPRGSIRVGWTPVATATRYVVSRRTGLAQAAVIANDITTNSFVDSTTRVGGRYYYTVVALNASGQSVASYEVGVTAGQAVQNDYDGDGKSDLAVFRPSNGTWYLRNTRSRGIPWGLVTDVRVPGDYDGDGRTDVAVFRPTDGGWYIFPSGTGIPFAYTWGNGADIPVPGDYDGDGRTDIAVFRPSTGIWYVIPSSTGAAYAYAWGAGADRPVPGDYDGDGRTDIAVFRPTTGAWYVVRSSTGDAFGYEWGNSADTPVPSDYDGDGRTDIAVFRPETGLWYIVQSSTGSSVAVAWGGAADLPVPGDYNGDGTTDIAVYRAGTWVVARTGTSFSESTPWGNSLDRPIVPAP